MEGHNRALLDVIDIDRLGELHRDDPDAFEDLRRQLIEEAIENFPPEYRARAQGIQFRLDQELNLCKDPISRMNRMVEIFWEGVQQFEAVIRNPEGYMEQKRRAAPGEVIPLRGEKRSLH